MSSTTLKTILEDFVREYQLGRVGTTTATDITTTLTDLTRFGGPFAGNEWNRGSPIRITGRLAVAGGAITLGQNTYVSDFDPATGKFTVLPALDDAPELGTNFIVMKPGTVEHSDRLLEALNRYLTRDPVQRLRVPLTYVPNGDYLSPLVATGWTVTGNAVIAYADQSAPDGWYPKLLKLTGGTTGQKVTSTTLKCNAGEAWNLALTMHVGIAANIASIVVQNETAGTAITPTFQRGAATTSSLSPVDILASFIIPAGCTQISIRPTVAASAQVGYFGPIIAAPQTATMYTGQTWLEFLKTVGRFWTYGVGTTGPVERSWRPLQLGRHDDMLGWGQGFSFELAPPFPLFFDCELSYAALVAGDPTGAASGSAASESTTTACPENLVLKGMAVEVFQYLHERDAQSTIVRGKVLITSKWLGHLNRAKDDLVTAQADWDAPKRPSVRKHFAGMARG